MLKTNRLVNSLNIGLYCSFFLLLCSTVFAVDISNITKSPDIWYGYYGDEKDKDGKRVNGEVNISLTKGMSDDPAILFSALKPVGKSRKSRYTNFSHTFKKPVDMSDVKGLSFYYKPDKDGLNFKIGLVDKRGKQVNWDWVPDKGAPGYFTKYSFSLDYAKYPKSFDFSGVKKLHIDFARWDAPVSDISYRVIIDKLTVDSDNDFTLIPFPRRGVNIDGEIKDWGFEDTLYNWTPPQYIYLNKRNQVLQGGWPGPKALSARCSFMIDEKNLYLLALVVDSTPGEGSSGNPWENDSIEFFFSFAPPEPFILKEGRKLSGYEFQFIFDLATQNHLISQGGRTRPFPSSSQVKIVSSSFVVEGTQTPGYIIEIKLPLADITSLKINKGAKLAFDIKLNDFRGTTLVLEPTNKSPWDNLKNWHTASVGFKKKEKDSAIAFGQIAQEAYWPQRYAGNGKTSIWGSESVVRKKISLTRERVYLNSLWAFQTVEGYKGPAPGKWGYIAVPEPFFFNTLYFSTIGMDGRLSNETGIYGPKTRGKLGFCWYERTFEVPRDWSKGRIWFGAEYIKKAGYLYINGTYLGELSVYSPPVDITELINYEGKNRIDIFVYNTSKKSLRGGITGDVYLEHYTGQKEIDDIWVKKASGIDGSYEIVVETQKRPAEIQLEILEDMKTVHQQKITPQSNKIVFTGAYKQFKPWSIEHPKLYYLSVKNIDDSGSISDEKILRFGFRTFEIKDARFKLNGKVLRLRSYSGVDRTLSPGLIERLKEDGYNMWFGHASENKDWNALLELLDEKGMVTTPGLDRSQSNERTARELRRYRNHPSAIMYVSDQFGLLSHDGTMHNPFQVDDTYYPDSRGAIKSLEFLRGRQKFFASVDPTRPYFPHATGNFAGCCRSNNHYSLYGTPLSDRISWYDKWSKRPNPRLPYYLIETGITLGPVEYLQPGRRASSGENKIPRYMIYEMASQYLGKKAFENWQEIHPLFAREALRGMRSSGVDGFTWWIPPPSLEPAYGRMRLPDKKAERKLSYKYFTGPIRDNLEAYWLRSNRGYYKMRFHVRRLLPAEYNMPDIKEKPSILAPVYAKEMQPLLIYIGGGARNRFSLEHNYFSGEQIDKQLIVVNDTETAQELLVEYSLLAEGKRISAGKETINIEQGAITKVPFSVRALTAAEKTRAQLELKAVNGTGKIHTDTFDITIFPEKSPLRKLPSKRIGVLRSGPESLTRKMGIETTDIDLSKDLSDNDLIVIERGALVKGMDTGELVKYLNGGGKVIVFEQTSDGLLDWRVRERRVRHLFASNPEHPVLKGLDDEDLTFFRAESRMSPAEQPPIKSFRNALHAGLDPFFITHEGTVATFLLNKPEYGSFQPILVGGYDLEETALLEVNSGKGSIIFCQVDVTDRYGIDPAATLLVDNIFNYMSRKKLSERKSVVYIGGDKGAEFLERLGVEFETAESFRKVLPGSIVVLGGNKEGNEKIPDNRNLTVVSLPIPNRESLSSVYPFVLNIKSVRLEHLDFPGFHDNGKSSWGFWEFYGPRPDRDNLPEPVHSVFQGLIDNDTYFFTGVKLPAVVMDSGGVEWKSNYGLLQTVSRRGNRYIFCQIDPVVMKQGEIRKKGFRIWSQIFYNLGVKNRFELSLKAPEMDLSVEPWDFVTDPADKGERQGFPEGRYEGERVRKLMAGKHWEEQGVTEANPSVYSPPDSAYDGVGWYFKKTVVPERLRGRKLYLHLDGVRAIDSYSKESGTDVWINGQPVKKLLESYNAKHGGRGARLFELPLDKIKYGQDNLLVIKIRNTQGPGGLFRKPVRLEVEGQNEEMLLPYEFQDSKFNPYYFWSF